MKRFALLTAACMAITLCGCGKTEIKQEIAVPIYKADDVEYKTAEATVGDITQRYYVDDAVIGAADAVSVYFKVGGTIDELKFSDGDMVKKGDVLATLKTDDLEDELAEKEIYLEQARKTLQTLIDDGVSGTELQLAQTDVELQQMEYDHLAATEEDYVVKAPCDGYFASDSDTSFESFISDQRDKHKIILPGVPVEANQRLGTVYDYSNNFLVCVVYDTQLNNVNFGTKVKITNGDYEGEGKVVDIKIGDNGGMGVYNYVISADEPDEINDMQPITCVFDIYSKLDVVLVPSDAIKKNKKRSYVNLLIDGAKIEQDVETGIEDGDYTEIISGLSGGETVILN